MRSGPLVGVALLVAGIFLLYFGFQATETFGEQLHETFTGRFTDTTSLYLIFGAISTLLGIGIISFPVFNKAN